MAVPGGAGAFGVLPVVGPFVPYHITKKHAKGFLAFFFITALSIADKESVKRSVSTAVADLSNLHVITYIGVGIILTFWAIVFKKL